MNTKRKHILIDYVWTGASLAAVFLLGLVGTNVHNHNVHIAHVKAVKISRLRHVRHLRYLHWKKWHLVWAAENHPNKAHLSELSYLHPEQHPIIYLNHDEPTLDRHAWHYDHVDFSGRDEYGRTSYKATAYLDRDNATGDALRVPQKVKPVGWHQQPDITSDGFDYILNRGHLIAYSLSKDIAFSGQHVHNRPTGNQNDRDNLFTETAFTNQDLQYTFETKVRMALERGKRVIYQAQPIFHAHDLMARGIHLQAASTDGKFHFNVYCFNVQPDIKFDYHTGQPSYDDRYVFPIPWKLIDNVQQADDDDADMRLQRRIMSMYKRHWITKTQVKWDESKIVNNHWLTD